MINTRENGAARLYVVHGAPGECQELGPIHQDQETSFVEQVERLFTPGILLLLNMNTRA